MPSTHEMEFGAQLKPGGGARFHLWAPEAIRVALCLEDADDSSPLPMQQAGKGWYEIDLNTAHPGLRYRFLINAETWVPDPASRFQPQGVHGPSELINPEAYQWNDAGWKGRPWEEAVLYELHVGAFTPVGTYAGVEAKLDHLQALGVTALELMPLSATPGARNWGYDGVLPFAPQASYGRPDDLKRLIDAAHQRGLMVFLDVVYNHFGPDGNYLHCYAPQFFTERYSTPWGAAINFDGGHPQVRQFFIENALYWIMEYHIDGLRLDAVHAIHDYSAQHILKELAEQVRNCAPDRYVHLVLENDNNASRYLERIDGQPQWYAAQWNDDLHHALHVLLTGEGAGYYEDYTGDPVSHLGRALVEGFAYQGEPSAHRNGAPRGESSRHLPPGAFVSFLQNHDQIGNRAHGERIAMLAAEPALRAALAVLLLAPSPPLLFMGEEWGSQQPFLFFCDFDAQLAQAVRDGRRREFERFPEFQDPRAREHIPDPNAEPTFSRTALDWTHADSDQGRRWLAYYRELLALRRAEILPLLGGVLESAGEFQRHGTQALSVQWRFAQGCLRLCANLHAKPAEELPPVRGRQIHASSPAMTEGLLRGVWPPWSVAWQISDSA